MGALLLSAAVTAQQCAKVQNSLYDGGFNVTEYTRATWYTWKQQVNNYQDEDDLYCVTATYNLEGTSVPGKSGPDSATVTVYNVATDSSLQVETGAVGEDPFLLCATPDSRDTESDPRLNVKPCFMPPFFGGPYWVVHLEVDSAGLYEVAVVIGGNPTVLSRRIRSTARSAPPRASRPSANGMTGSAACWATTRSCGSSRVNRSSTRTRS